MGDEPIWTSLPLFEVLASPITDMASVWRAAYLGENVVRENEYLSAIM